MKLFRTSRHLSQKDVALSVGIPQGQYSRIENGKVEPSLSTLEKLTNFFEVPMAMLFQNELQIINNHAVANTNNSPLLEKVMQLDLLDKDEKTTILALIDMAISKKQLKDSLNNLIESNNAYSDTPTFNAIKLKTKDFKLNREEANAR